MTLGAGANGSRHIFYRQFQLRGAAVIPLSGNRMSVIGLKRTSATAEEPSALPRGTLGRASYPAGYPLDQRGLLMISSVTGLPAPATFVAIIQVVLISSTWKRAKVLLMNGVSLIDMMKRPPTLASCSAKRS